MVENIGKLIELDELLENRINTGWLDRIIKEAASRSRQARSPGPVALPRAVRALTLQVQELHANAEDGL